MKGGREGGREGYEGGRDWREGGIGGREGGREGGRDWREGGEGLEGRREGLEGRREGVRGREEGRWEIVVQFITLHRVYRLQLSRIFHDSQGFYSYVKHCLDGNLAIVVMEV